MSNQTNKKYQINRGSKDLARQLRSIWLPLHHSIRNLSFEFNTDGNYLKDLVRRLGLRTPELSLV